MSKPRKPVCPDSLLTKAFVLEGLCYALDDMGSPHNRRTLAAQAGIINRITSLAATLAKGLDEYLTFQHGK